MSKRALGHALTARASSEPLSTRLWRRYGAQAIGLLENIRADARNAEVLIERILFLDGSPSMMPLELKVGGTVKGMLESDLALEVRAVKQYNDAVAVATREGDNGSRDLLVTLLKDEEEHVDFLEAQMHQIKELGYERYLAQQVGEHEEE